MTNDAAPPPAADRPRPDTAPTIQRFAGKVALVTAASRGIGFSVAERVVDEGGQVVITARKADQLQAAARALGGDRHAIAVAGSAADAQHRGEAVRRAVDHFGGLDVLINNAGINPLYGSMLEADMAAGARIFETNVLGSLGWVRDAIELGMKKGGSIVNVASAAGLRPSAGIGLYGSSKAAVIHMTQQLALELAPHIRVNAVAPAVVRTKFAGLLYEEREESVTARYPLGRLGLPSDIAAAVAFLASDEASWITGQTLTLDGGLMITGGV